MKKTEAIAILKKVYTDWLHKQERQVLTEILADDYESYLADKEPKDIEVIAAINYKLSLDIEE